MHLDGSIWNDEQAEAVRLARKHNLLEEVRWGQVGESEYPTPGVKLKESLRSAPCPCGRGKKLKKCCSA